MDKIRVWLASNLETSRSSTVLARCPSLECAGQSDSSCDALERIQASKPDVIVLEVAAHDRQINSILKHLTDSIPTTRIIVVGSTDDKHFVMRLLRLGVQGYLSERDLETELARAIAEVMQGNVFLCPMASGALVREYRKCAQSRRPGPADGE